MYILWGYTKRLKKGQFLKTKMRKIASNILKGWPLAPMVNNKSDGILRLKRQSCWTVDFDVVLFVYCCGGLCNDVVLKIFYHGTVRELCMRTLSP